MTTLQHPVIEQTCNTLRPKTGGILHVHPLLRCNLTCKHCYSDSSPHRNEALEPEDILPLMEYAKEIGYDVLSVSGGEPFLYKQLDKLLKCAKEMGMRTQLVTNGTLLETAFADECLRYLDLVAISIDGDEELHDFVRNKAGSYKKAIKAAQKIHSRKIPLGIIHAVTNNSWSKLIEVADLAYSLGAGLLQLHPLEMSGRALTELPDGLSTAEFHKAYILFNYLQEKFTGKMKIQMDCLHRLLVNDNPQLCGFSEDPIDLNETNYARVVRSIIVTESGNVLPYSYGMDSKYSIGNVKHKSVGEIGDMFSAYFDERSFRFSNLLNRSYTLYKDSSCEEDLVVWSEYIVAQSKLPF